MSTPRRGWIRGRVGVPPRGFWFNRSDGCARLRPTQAGLACVPRPVRRRPSGSPGPDLHDVRRFERRRAGWCLPWGVGDSRRHPSDELADFTKNAMPVVVQCKFSVDPTGTLTPSDLADELEKVEALHGRGQCDGYMVLTNLRVTGATHAWFAGEVRKRGPQAAKILPGTWICAQIEKNWNLRRHVPRVYGLGDLSTILDDRKMRQARALLTSLSRELETFVPTEAYRRASDALATHGFVLLLGEPACGKSTIAAMLCMTALDNWGCDVMRVSGPDELLEHWNPDDPYQMFWVDDAFGSIRHEPHLTDGWARRLQEVMAAVAHGARVLMTSRDYIYREARPRLKDYAYPRLREQQVVIDVAMLSTAEKEEMLYNHLKAGDQPAEVLERWRPHLRAVASTERFQPEVARRLSLRAFMPEGGLTGKASLVAYFEHPNEFLVDVLNGLEPAQRAALAAVYMATGELQAPFNPDSRVAAAVTALGTTVHETGRAFMAIAGTFLSQTEDAAGNPVWQFHHPTIREGFALAASRDVATLAVCLEGMTDEELISQLDCGGPNQRGTLIQVPPSLYHLVAPRIPVPARSAGRWSPVVWFLRSRCSTKFLRLWAEQNAAAIRAMAHFGQMVEAMWQPYVLARLNESGVLDDDVRKAAVQRIVDYAIEDLDPGWGDIDLRPLFTSTEWETMSGRVEHEVLPDLESRIGEYASWIGSDWSKEEIYQAPRSYVDAIREVFDGRDDVQARCDRVEEYIAERSIEDDAEDRHASRLNRLAPAASPARTELANERDPFDDIAAGH